MSRASLFVAVLITCSLPLTVSAQDLPDQIKKYFVGNWNSTGPEEGQTATAHWKLVAAGRATAGHGTNSKTGANFHFARWESADKTWVHDWAEEKGGYGRLEITRFEKDTYYGKARAVDETGKSLSGDARVLIKDQDNFDYAITSGDLKLTSHWSRQK